jgi:hypothetical protein
MTKERKTMTNKLPEIGKRYKSLVDDDLREFKCRHIIGKRWIQMEPLGQSKMVSSLRFYEVYDLEDGFFFFDHFEEIPDQEPATEDLLVNPNIQETPYQL